MWGRYNLSRFPLSGAGSALPDSVFTIWKVSHENKTAFLSTKYWLFNRDPYNGLIPVKTG